MDREQERQRLAERYAATEDGCELQEIASGFFSLATIAQERLRAELANPSTNSKPEETPATRRRGSHWSRG
jgi:hypothetical protein